MLGRVVALGWSAQDSMIVVAGAAPLGDPETALDVLRRAADHHGLDLLTGIHGTTLLAVVGHGSDPMKSARLLAPHFGPGPGRGQRPGLVAGGRAACDPIGPAGLRAAWGWADAPRPVAAADLLPERALAGDAEAIDALVATVHRALLADAALYDTATTYLERTPSLEATARVPVHPPQHRPLPPAPDRRCHRLQSDRRPRRVHAADRAHPRPARRRATLPD